MSYIVITCRNGADPDNNRLLLRTPVQGSNVPSYIKLHAGINKLDVLYHPDLKYGFYNGGCDSGIDFWEASENCQDIIEIDLRHFDGSGMTTMDSMFYYMFNLERIYLDGIDTSNVESMAFAFCGVGQQIKSWSTVNSTHQKPDIGFHKDNGMLIFDLSGLNVGKVRELHHLFDNSGGVLNDASHKPVFILFFNGWQLYSTQVVSDMFTGVDYLAQMTLFGCDQTTVDAISDEWLDYLAASKIITQ